MTNEYIRRQDAVSALANYIMNVDKVYSTGKLTQDDCIDCAESVLDELPSADVVQVVHAHWTDTDNYYRRWRCSACSGHTKEAHPQFCPFCGAKMDGEE